MLYFIYDGIIYIGSSIKDTTTHYYYRTKTTFNRFCYNYVYTTPNNIVLNV